MGKKVALPLIAAFGLLFAIFVVIYGSRKSPVPKIAFPPPAPPYRTFIAASGVIEAASENIYIGTPFAEIAVDVFAKAGEFKTEGDPLIQLDIRTFQAQMNQAQTDRERALIEYENYKTQLELYNSLDDRRAVSENEYNQAYYAAESARAAIAQAEAKIEVAQSYIERSTIRAPMDGQILQVNIRKGEIANLNPFTQLPLIVFGPVCPLHVRVSIDEDDAWRFLKGAPAMAYVRGNSSLSFPMKYVRTEPLVIPKQGLTGATSERVDTRVLQAVYEFDKDRLPVYLGQILDVYIESIPADTRSNAPNRWN